MIHFLYPASCLTTQYNGLQGEFSGYNVVGLNNGIVIASCTTEDEAKMMLELLGSLYFVIREYNEKSISVSV